MPSHTRELIEEVLSLTAPGAALIHPLERLADAATRVQSSLREAQADSPTINSDPCVVLLTGEIGRRLQVDDLNSGLTDTYERCSDQVTSWLTDISGKAVRARAADAARGGACNLTPLARSLHKAITTVTEEGARPEEDPAIRVIAHQMSHLTNTYSWAPDGIDAQRMRAMAQAQLAKLVIEDAQSHSPSLRPA